ncbi:hypothetical protein ThrDRAFT_00080 [Frankia casuarinae]|uniref:ABC-type multidrug transport system ATPase component-like n=2 Tax=Frankia casuarinae (strain DSM 45818 / CECT 9043 / HFP020203 / CcI3) TaxID=106370 RepID=Q2JGZ9_FRACC|nr:MULTISPECIES: ATP-binding cassette domain-containing protein [Frankia]ABD09443.1 ABC-type multidrug transport system ATPase component-like [Frankia casuarinae]ETA02771.1 hypothetical protein CcI6DRAFT_01731 [Frankia sp. CcI6]EYT94156.1 hypothetical protein ThrDRAFT_00080 [Frankia casuarinae]OFB42302.1 hypothetical protein Manayef4_01910 [Frankia sp. CgIM4]OHV52266.1 hypothetical protein CgIS1_02780 [Frankia sp. CgIS1]
MPRSDLRREALVTAVVEIDHLAKRYGSQRAVRDVSFTVREGNITGFLRPNGSGKTTTLRILLSLVTPGSGSVLVFGGCGAVEVNAAGWRVVGWGVLAQVAALLAVRRELPS